MKTIFALIFTLIGVTVNARIKTETRELKIYCHEAAVLPDAKEFYFVEILSQRGHADDYVKAGRVSNVDTSKITVETEQFVKKTDGSIVSGEVMYFLTEFPKDRKMNYLSILYPWGLAKTSMLPSIYVGFKDGKHFSVAMSCSHAEQGTIGL